MHLRSRTTRHGLAALCLAAVTVSRLDAAVVVEESFALVAGWNLIDVPIEPSVKDPQLALAAIDWESLWTWLPGPEPRGGRWLAAHRAHPPFLSSLVGFTGPGPYLILARTGGTLRLQGAIRSRREGLRGGAYQLFGPRFERTSPPTFASYFSRPGVSDHIGPAFELAGQTYRRLSAGDSLRPGAAYWLFPDQDIPAPDPLRLGVGLGGLQFDAQTTLGELVVDVGDASGSGAGGGLPRRQLGVRARGIGAPGSTDWLELERPDGSFAAIGAGTSIDVAPEQTEVRVTIRASQETISSSPTADQQAVLELTLPQGQVVLGAELDVPGLRGTWIGDATIAEVEQPSFHGGGFAPAPEMRISLILEVPATGPSRLLPCVGVAAARDGRSVTHRLEAALFHVPVALAGTVAQDGGDGTLTGSTGMPADHPLNPYRHRYHPEHTVGLDFARTIRLRFGAESPVPVPESAFARVGALEGVYEEEIQGLTQEPIRVRGAFRLRRMASDAVTVCPEGAQ